jgi:hypothetical protein
VARFHWSNESIAHAQTVRHDFVQILHTQNVILHKYNKEEEMRSNDEMRNYEVGNWDLIHAALESTFVSNSYILILYIG